MPDSISLGKHLWWWGPVVVALTAILDPGFMGRRFTFGRHEDGPRKTTWPRGDAPFLWITIFIEQ